MNSKLIARYFTRETLGIVMVGVALFWSAGTLNWWPAWALLLVTLAWVIATGVVILCYQPGLLAERLGPRKGARRWDMLIMGLIGVLQLARYIVAGLDQRNTWSGEFPLALQIAALLLCSLGYAIFVWATRTNAFFSQIVRIQTERGQVVVVGGPYHYVRHPAYIGAILVELAVPVLLASWWALLISAVTVALLILRTALEDQMLQVELYGYAEYAHQVRQRLLPGIW
jgi:protein-S-isoprenylcysteine O-methyltransferase Ste14